MQDFSGGQTALHFCSVIAF